MAFANPVDSVLQQIEGLPLPDRFKAIDELSFKFITENNRQVIPFLLQYEQKAVANKKPESQARICIHLSLAYYYLGKYDENVKYALQAIHLFDSLGNKSQLGTMYGELGYQMKRRNLPQAFVYMRQGINVLEQINDAEALAKIYDNYGVLHEMNNRFDSALYFYTRALQLKKLRNDTVGLPYSLNNIFALYMLMDKPDSALVYLRQSTVIRQQLNDMIGLAENYSYLGQFYSSLNQPANAIEWYQKSLDIALRHNYTYLVQSLYQALSVEYESQGNFQQALTFHKLFKQFNDSLINLESNKTIANLQVQYQTAEKERELEVKKQQLLREKSIRIFIISGSFVLFILLLVFFVNRMQINRRNEKIKIRNALIEGEQAERNRLALELHDGIANDLNAVILTLNNDPAGENREKTLLKLKKAHQSVRQLSHNLMPRSLKEQGLDAALRELQANFTVNNLSVDLQINGLQSTLSPFIAFNIYRITQEALNNVVKHACASQVLIDVRLQQSKLMLTIEDNGKGLSDHTLSKKGIGLQNIDNRVKMMDGKWHMVSKAGEGTSIEIEIKI
jgi:signal transduction histidine kinase